jgi:hypothetical protein
MYRILLTGGRAPVTLELARQFSATGHRVLVADSLPHQFCTCSVAVAKNFLVPEPRYYPAQYIAELERIIQAEQVDYLIPTCEEIFYISAGLDRLKPLCHVLAEPLTKLEPLHNKWQFIQRMQAIGLTVPQTWLIQSEQDLQAVLNASSPKKIVLKPVYSRFASQVHFVTKPVETPMAIDLRPDKPWVAQEFIAGKHYCIYGIAHQGKLTAFAAYSTVFTAGAGSCISFEAVKHPPLLAWMETVVTAEQFTGQIAFDMIETPDKQLYPLECNPRAISAIHLFDKSDRLDQAFFNQTPHLIEPLGNNPAMISLAMLIYGLPDAIATQRLPLWIKTMLTSKDVIFQWRDPLPAFHVGVMLYQFIRMALQRRQTLQQVSTQDIEWDGAAIDVSL